MTNIPDEVLHWAKARLAELDRERSYLRGLVDIYEPKDMEGDAVGTASSVPPRAARTSRGGRRHRSLSPEWTTILRFIGESGEANYDAMEAFAASQGLQISRSNLRSQMTIYGGRGWVDGRGNGVWALTDAGRTKIGLRNGSAGLQSERPAPSSSSDSKSELLSHAATFALLNPNAAEEAEEVSGVLATTQ